MVDDLRRGRASLTVSSMPSHEQRKLEQSKTSLSYLQHRSLFPLIRCRTRCSVNEKRSLRRGKGKYETHLRFPLFPSHPLIPHHSRVSPVDLPSPSSFAILLSSQSSVFLKLALHPLIMSITFLMIPTLTLTPPTPLPPPSPLKTFSTFSFEQVIPQEEPSFKQILNLYFGRQPVLPFTNFELVNPVEMEATESVRNVEKIARSSRKGWHARKKAKRAKEVVKVEKKLESAFEGLGW